MPEPQPVSLSALLARFRQAPCPFYERRLDAAGFKRLADLDARSWARVPLTRHEDILHDQLEHLPHGTRRFRNAEHPVRAGISGSGDGLLVLTWTAADLAGERAAGTRLLQRLGVTPGMRVANTLPGALATPGALLLGDSIEELGALDIPLGVIDSDSAARGAWELMDRVLPDVVILDIASAPRLFAAAPAAARGWWRGIIWLRDASDPGAAAAAPPATGFTGWQRAWLAVAEATSFVAHSCAALRFHANDHVLVEVVDEATGATAEPGQVGTLVLTPLAGDTLLLRYASGIRARAVPPPCACGAEGVGLELN